MDKSEDTPQVIVVDSPGGTLSTEFAAIAGQAAEENILLVPSPVYTVTGRSKARIAEEFILSCMAIAEYPAQRGFTYKWPYTYPEQERYNRELREAAEAKRARRLERNKRVRAKNGTVPA